MADMAENGEPFKDMVEQLATELWTRFEQAAELGTLIWANLEELGYGLPAQ